MHPGTEFFCGFGSHPPEHSSSYGCGSRWDLHIFLAAVECVPFKSIEEGGIEAESAHSCDVLQRTFLCVPILPHTRKMLPHLTTEQLGSRNGSKPWYGLLKTINSALDWFQCRDLQPCWSQTSWASVSMWHLISSVLGCGCCVFTAGMDAWALPSAE